MKKLGFTLSELLAALAIIGVVSAITVPMVSGILPDKNKVNVLKVYKLVNDLNKDMLTNNGLYFQSGEVDDEDIPIEQCIGLACTQKPVLPGYNETYAGMQKYARLLYEHLEGDEEGTSFADNQSSFYTVDGISWVVDNCIIDGDGTEPDPFQMSCTITVDFDKKSSSPNCNFMSCDKPDQFSFNVDTRGYLTGQDPLTRAYLTNPHKLNDKKKDFAEAKRLKGQ